MTWLLWRQNRSSVAWAGALLAVLAVLALATGLRMQPVDRDTPYSAMIFLFNITVALPLVLGVFYGVTCIARETEQSTHVLTWTQTLTRRRWLLGKIGTAIVSAVAIEAAVAALVTWWSGPLGHNRFQPLNFIASAPAMRPIGVPLLEYPRRGNLHASSIVRRRP